jgi:hypothetical protein
VTDAGRQSVVAFLPDGTLLAEIHESGGWKGFTLPAAVARLSSTALLSTIVSNRGWPPADEYFAVSDAMGGMPLVLMGVVNRTESTKSAR